MTQPAPRRTEHGGLRHLPELDGVRGIAALLVFFHHACYSTLTGGTITAWPRWTQVLYHSMAVGNSGVDLFFVLSGFLITSILIEARGSDRYYQDFYWKRALRILPLYLVVLAAVALALHQWGYVLLSLVFLVNFAEIFHVAGIGPFWTLAIEEQFYLVWPTVVRRQRVETLLRSAVAIGAVAVVLRFAFALRGHHNYYLTPLVCDTLVFGVALACIYRRGGLRRSLRAATVLCSCVALGVLLAEWNHLQHAWTLAISGAVYKSSVTLIAGGLVGLCINSAGSQRLAVLRSPLLRFFGLISFAFYMVHLYVLLAWDRWIGLPTPGDTRMYVWRVAACFAASVALAVVSRYVIELPAMRLRRHVLSPAGKREAVQHSDEPL